MRPLVFPCRLYRRNLTFFALWAKERIMLIPEHRESLRSCLSSPLRVRAVLARATPAPRRALFDDNYDLVCDKRDARILLGSAKKELSRRARDNQTA
jgi:hypothetical protein